MMNTEDWDDAESTKQRRSSVTVLGLLFLALAGAWLLPVQVARGRSVGNSILHLADSRVALAAEHLLPLVYHGSPLPEVIEDIQPYMQRRIVVDATAAEFQYSGIVKREDIGAWIRDLPSIYPVTVVDCQNSKSRIGIAACADPTLIVIRSRLDQYKSTLRSALRPRGFVSF
jgi:hypothetical protein